MDSDGFNHRYLTAGETMVLTPRLSPKAAQLAYVSFAGGMPQVRVLDVGSGAAAAAGARATRSASRRAFRPTARRIVFSMMPAPNSDIYVAGAGRRAAAAADDLARHRHRPELLARRKQDRVRKRPRRIAAALRDERRRLATSAGSASAAAATPRPNGARTASGSPSPGAAGTARRIGIIRPDGTGEKHADRRPGRRRAELGGEQPRAGLPAHRRRRRAGLYRSASTAASRAR